MSPDARASRASDMYFSAICAAVPRILTSGPLDSKFRANGFWGFAPQARPRRFCCPCLIGFYATLISGSCRDFFPALDVVVCSDLQRPSSLVTRSSRAGSRWPRPRSANTILLLRASPGTEPINVLITHSLHKNRRAIERHLNVPRGTPPYDRGSRDVRSSCRLHPASALNANCREHSNLLFFSLARTS